MSDVTVDAAGRESPAIMVEGVNVRFRDRDGKAVRVLRDLDLEIPMGQFTAIVGRSGCGKTTLLNVLAGLIEPDSGSAKVLGRAPIAARSHMGFMPARDALMPWRSALRNVEYGLELRRIPRAVRRERARQYLELVGLAHAAQRWPWQLSQGMRQRVALARAWVLEPDVLLMDEPFAALDAQTRESVRDHFVSLLDSGKRCTVVLVTHDLEEAVILADRIVVLGEGRVIADMAMSTHRTRNPDELFENAEKLAILRQLRSLL